MSRRLKVIFAGLEHGGKTSIIRTLERKEYVIEELRPTRGIQHFNIDILNCTITEWDFGGQEEYRKQYIEKKENFYDTDLLFYVIDMVDVGKFTETSSYYENIIEILLESRPKPPIIILFHKCENVKEIDDEKVKNLQNSLMKVSKDFDTSFFQTTIFEPQTLMNAFSCGINKISKKSAELKAQLKDLAEQIFADAIFLIENNGFIIGDYSKDDESRLMCMNVYNYLMGAVSFMYKKLEKNKLPERILIDWEAKGYSVLDSIEIEDNKFYYIKFTRNPRKIVQKFVLRSLIKSSTVIKEILKSYFG